MRGYRLCLPSWTRLHWTRTDYLAVFFQGVLELQRDKEFRILGNSINAVARLPKPFQFESQVLMDSLGLTGLTNF
jgi:hypothetical protein